MIKNYPDFNNQKTEKVNMFEEVELPANLKGLVINSIQKEKRRKKYKIASFAAAILLIIIAPSYFYLNFNRNIKNPISLNNKNIDKGITALNGKKIKEKSISKNEAHKDVKTGGFETTNKHGKDEKNRNTTDDKIFEYKTNNNLEASKNEIMGKGIGENNKQSANNNSKTNENNYDFKNNKETKVINQQPKSNIYSKQTAINQNASTQAIDSYGTSISGSADKSLKTSKLSGSSTDNSIDKTQQLDKSNQINKSNVNTQDTGVDSDSSQSAETNNVFGFAASNNDSGIDDENKNSIDNNDNQDKINQELKCQKSMGVVENTVNISLNSNMTIIELENILNEMNLKDYVVKDNQIEVDCKVIDYINLKDYLNKTYQNKVNYNEPENINEKQDTDVKLIIQI